MPTATYQRPNFTTQAAAQYKASIDAAATVYERLAGAFAPHENNLGSPQPDMSIIVDAGAIFPGGVLTEQAAQFVTGFTTPSSGQERIDRVVIDASTGVASRVAGTAGTGSPSPAAPAVPGGKIPVCRIRFTDADTVIRNDMITDERVPVAPTVSNIPYATRNLIITPNSGTPNSQIDIDADEVQLRTSGGDGYLATNVNLTIDITASGANGLDTGAEGNSTWYHLYVIYNGTSQAGLASASSSAPTLPSGYTYSHRVGAAYNDGSGNFRYFWQHQNRWSSRPVAAFSLQTGQTSYTSQSISGQVPPTARWALGYMASGESGVRSVHVAGDSSGLGECPGVHPSGAGAAFPYAPFRVPLPTAQTVYWKSSNADASQYDMNITGFEF